MRAVELVATLTTPFSASGEELRKISTRVSGLQVRADLAGDLPARRLREHFTGKLLYALRGTCSGGTFAGANELRHKRLIAAAKEFDLVELEADSDLSPNVLSAIPAEKRLIYWRGAARNASDLLAQFSEMATVPARSYCIVATVSRTSDALQPLLLLKTLRRADVSAFGEGPAGLWSQILAPYFGSAFLFGQLRHQMRSSELSIEQLIDNYGFPLLRPVRELYGIIGKRVSQSLSPRLHNAAYRALPYPALFVPFEVDCFADFWREMTTPSSLAPLGLSLQGLTVVSPHKEAAFAAAGASSAMVRRAGAANIFLRKNDVWIADTTDPESLAPSMERGLLRDTMKAAVVGCGGAGRAVAAALEQAGAKVTLVNRGKARGDQAVRLLGLPFILLSEFRAQGFTLLVNATPVGRDDGELPFAIDSLSRDVVVIDLAYGLHPTQLASRILAMGGAVVDGHDVLLAQVRKQFRMMIGREFPMAVSHELVANAASHSDYDIRREAVRKTACSVSL
jgi:3-dehydroquinate dehydratase/shikimate dehydrogenase